VHAEHKSALPEFRTRLRERVVTVGGRSHDILTVIDKMGPPLNESRGDIEALMRQHKCEASSASDSKATTAPKPARLKEMASPPRL
jgi:hypothetical protein